MAITSLTLGSCLFLCVDAQPSEDKIEGLRLPLLTPNESEPWATIEIDSIEKRTQKLGSFRINIAHTALLKNAKCEFDLRNTDQSSSWAELDEFCAQAPLKIEGLQLVLETQSRLVEIKASSATYQSSSKALILKEASLELSKGPLLFDTLILRYDQELEQTTLYDPAKPRRIYTL